MSQIYQLDPKLPFAGFVNPKIADSQRLGLAFQYNQIIDSYPGDPLAGQPTPGTSLAWNKLTETQGLIYEWFATQAAANPTEGLPSDLQSTLEAYPGPDDRWNYSYESWGVVVGVPGKILTVNTVEVGTGHAVTVIVP